MAVFFEAYEYIPSSNFEDKATKAGSELTSLTA